MHVNLPVGRPGAGAASLSGGKYDIKVLITSAVMFLATLFPFFKINAGAIGDIAMPYLSEFLPGMNNGKANLYGLLKLSKLLTLPDLAEFSKYRVLIIIVFILAILTIIACIASGVLNNKTVSMVAGILSAVCCIVFLVYIIALGHVKGQLNSLFAGELGDLDYYLGELIGGGKLIKSLNGFGGWLFMLTCGVQAFFGLSKAFKK